MHFNGNDLQNRIRNRCILLAVSIIIFIVLLIGLIRGCSNQTDGTEKSNPIAQSIGNHGSAYEEGQPLFDPANPSTSSNTANASAEASAVPGPVKQYVYSSVAGYGLLEYDADMTNGYLNNCIFLGDSRTVAMVMYGIMPQEQVLAQIGITHMAAMSNIYTTESGQEYTFQDYLLSHPAPVIYVGYGVNGMSSEITSEYKNSYRSLIRKIKQLSPKSKIVIMSIWPVEDDGVYALSAQNEWINRYNDFLYDLAIEEEVFYLDVNTILTDDDGTMINYYNSGDGLHYAAYAYPFILEYIVHHPVPGIQADGTFVINRDYAKPAGTYLHFGEDVSGNSISDNSISDNSISDNSISDNSVSDNTVSENETLEDETLKNEVSGNEIL